MVESYPALTLEQVHGALAFYLANQNEVDAYLAEGQRIAAAQHEESRRFKHTHAKTPRRKDRKEEFFCFLGVA
jgi:hypothetical protein